jgi:murein DD-endopeptidase MepM/ murein hydrolase activator NlpD
MTSAYNPGSRFKPRSPYRNRVDPFTGTKTEFHAGQDFAAPSGTPVPAATSGTVVYSGPNQGFGNVVIVKNDAGGYSLYGHMQDGARAALGQRILARRYRWACWKHGYEHRSSSALFGNQK